MMTISAREFETAFVATDLTKQAPKAALAPDAKLRKNPYRKGAKRAFESFVIFAALPIVLPFVLLMALIIALDGANPFFAQKRVGKDNKGFRIWKLRTMVANAEEKLESYLQENPTARAEWNSTQKLKSDPRITPVGRLLRKTSMDELPQLYNVLNGTMSLIGPRPMMIDQAPLYRGRAYYRLRPGITGLWQISARNESEFTSRVRYDELYERSLSFRNDLGILVRTIKVVLRGTGY